MDADDQIWAMAAQVAADRGHHSKDVARRLYALIQTGGQGHDASATTEEIDMVLEVLKNWRSQLVSDTGGSGSGVCFFSNS